MAFLYERYVLTHAQPQQQTRGTVIIAISAHGLPFFAVVASTGCAGTSTGSAEPTRVALTPSSFMRVSPFLAAVISCCTTTESWPVLVTCTTATVSPPGPVRVVTTLSDDGGRPNLLAILSM